MSELRIAAWPVTAPISGRFGETNYLEGRPAYVHRGLDFKAHYEQVFSVCEGVVSSFINDGSFGMAVCFLHESGLYLLYAHLSARNVFLGDRVHVGTLIGTSGNTGASTGPHLPCRSARRLASPRTSLSVATLNSITTRRTICPTLA